MNETAEGVFVLWYFRFHHDKGLSSIHGNDKMKLWKLPSQTSLVRDCITLDLNTCFLVLYFQNSVNIQSCVNILSCAMLSSDSSVMFSPLLLTQFLLSLTN